MSLLQTLHEENRTILLVTHDPGVATYASREIVLSDGAIVADRAVSQSTPRESAL